MDDISPKTLLRIAKWNARKGFICGLVTGVAICVGGAPAILGTKRIGEIWDDTKKRHNGEA